MINNFDDKNDIFKISSEIREATLDDVADIQALTKKLFVHEISEGYSDNLDSNWSFSEEGKKEIQERITSKKSSCGFVFMIDNQIVGYLIGRILEEETGRAELKYADLEYMFVDDKYRGRSIGEKLVKKFKNWVKSKGLKIIKTNVSYKNKGAISFYTKMGLIPADVTMKMTVE